MASSKIGNLTSGSGRKLSQIGTSELQEIYLSTQTRGRDRSKIAKELRKRQVEVPELPKSNTESIADAFRS